MAVASVAGDLVRGDDEEVGLDVFGRSPDDLAPGEERLRHAGIRQQVLVHEVRQPKDDDLVPLRGRRRLEQLPVHQFVPIPVVRGREDLLHGVAPRGVGKSASKRISVGSVKSRRIPLRTWIPNASVLTAPFVAHALCMHIASMRKRTVTIRGVSDATLKALRARSAANHRSLNGELLVLLEGAVAESSHRTPTQVREAVPEPYIVTAPPEPATAIPDAVHRDALAAVCRRHHIRWLAVFGSHARGDARPESDVDVVVDFEPGMTPGLGIVRVAEALRSVFGGRRVDLVTRRGLSPRLRGRVLATALVLYGA